ncbi:glycosyltransferase family 4 protein [Candidatus Parcubacteria bacterium]|nr:glycosyltransferase family 4 protein [Candidatus Parcubacteria bacterium]
MKIVFLTHNLGHDNGGGVFSRRIIEGANVEMPADVVALTSVSSNLAHEKAILAPGNMLSLKTVRKVRAEIRDADVVHAIDAYPYGLMAAVASIGLRKKIIITAVGSGSILPLYKVILAPFVRWAYRRADTLTAISGFTRDEVLKKAPGIAMKIITPGIDFEDYQKKAVVPEYVVHYKPYVLSVGSLRWRKGYKYSIVAFAEVHKVFPEMHYVIVGKKYTDATYAQIEEKIKEHNLEKYVHVLDNIDDIEKLRGIYKEAELFWLMSQNKNHDVEGFGIVFLEAAAHGLPVIGAEKCGVVDAVDKDKNGFLADSRDPKAFAQAAIRILENKVLRQKMSQHSTEWAKQHDWKFKMPFYIEIYRSLTVDKK